MKTDSPMQSIFLQLVFMCFKIFWFYSICEWK